MPCDDDQAPVNSSTIKRPRSLVIGAAQLGPATDDIDHNVATIQQLIEQAAESGCHIVAFPELAFTKYFCVRNFREYEAFFEAKTSQRLQCVRAAAKRHRMALILPYGEKGGIAYYNSAVVIDERGNVAGLYRKAHIAGSFPQDSGAITFERLFFTPGDLGFPVFEVNGVHVGIQICHDRNFPEGFRILALKGAEIVFVPTNMPAWHETWTSELWELVLRTRALENGYFVVGIGKAGVEDGLRFVGDSIIVSPVGARVLARAGTDREEIVASEVSLDQIVEARRQLPWMRDRRPELYKMIATFD